MRKNFAQLGMIYTLLVIGLVALALFAVSVARADTAWFYDPTRSGEGIVLSELDTGGLVFSFYSFVKTPFNQPPRFGPDPLYCDEDNIWLIGVADHYIVGDHASGKVYYNRQIPSYPVAVNDRVSDQHHIGEFTAVPSGGGWVIRMENNWTMCDLSIFGTDFYMTTLLAE
jgi:hypothetical protein